MEAAGLSYPPHPPSPWSKESLVAELRRLHSPGNDLSLVAVKHRHSGSLLGPALHRFGSWRKALEAAGIPYFAVARVREWNKELVITELRKRYTRSQAIGGGALQKEDLRLWAAAKPRFRTYQHALEAASLPVPRSPEEWSSPTERLLRTVREVRAAGGNVASGSIRRSHPSLFYATRERMRSWRMAVESAGLDYQSIRRAREWSQPATEALVLKEIRELHAQGGRTFGNTTVKRQRHSFFWAAKHSSDRT
jgi:hypothetical protein